MCFLMFGPLTTYWRVSEIPMCLKEEREDTGYHDFSRFLPGLAAGTESRMSIGGQWSLREKMQQGFLHQTKPLCSCTSSCFSSLPLLRWLFALLLLEQLKFLWPGKGAIAGVHELPQVVPRGGRTPWLMGSGLVIPSARALQSSYLVTAHIAKWERNIRQHRQTEGKKI